MSDDSPSALAPVLQLFMLLPPTVANAFLLVYVLLGVVLEGEQKLRWDAEAVEVALYIAGGVVVFCALLFALLRYHGRPARHPLAVANLVQIALAVLMLGAVLALRGV